MNVNFWLEEIGRSRKARKRAANRVRNLRFNTVAEPVAAPGGAAPAAAPIATSPPPAAPAPSTPPPAVPSSAAGPGTSGLPAPGATPVPAAPAPTMPPEEWVRQQFGVDPNQLRTLVTAGYRQVYGNGQQQPAQQPQPAAPQPAKPANPFGLPEFDRRYLDFVQNGPNGLEAVPGAPLDAVYRVKEYREKLLNAQYEFFENPRKFFEPIIAEIAKQQAGDVYQQQFGQHQSQNVADRIMTENGSWLFQHDANGQPVQQYNPATGRMAKVPTPAGQLYGQYLDQLEKSGVSDLNMQHQLAVTMLKNNVYEQQRQQSQAPAAGQAAAQNFLNNAAGRPAAPTPVVPNLAPTEPAAQPLTLRQQLAADLQAAGLDDTAVRNQLRG